MKIAIICRPDVPVPPLAGYGGLQRNVYDFIREIDRRGSHDLFLFASLDSDLSRLKNVALLGNLDHALWAGLVVNDRFAEKTEAQIVETARLAAEKEQHYIAYILEQLPALNPDIILVAYDNTVLMRQLAPFYYKTIWSIRDNMLPEKHQLLSEHPELTATALAGHIKQDSPGLDNLHTIMWGVNTQNFDFSERTLSLTDEVPSLELLRRWQAEGRDYLAMVAGIGAHKGQMTAIQIAQASGMPLIIAGTPQDHMTLKKTRYFKQQVKPHTSDNIVYFGNANELQKIDLLRYAKATISASGIEFPVFKEPFGRAIAESLAVGTPVIGYRYGSLPYMIKEGVSGYLFETVQEAVSSVKKLDMLNRWEVRQWADIALSIERVVDQYEELFSAFENRVKQIANVRS